MLLNTLDGKETARLKVKSSISTRAMLYSLAVNPSLKTISRLKERKVPQKRATTPITENSNKNNPLSFPIDFSSFSFLYLE